MDKNEKNLVLVHSAEEKKSAPKTVTSPIQKMFLDFRGKSKENKLRPWELFKD